LTNYYPTLILLLYYLLYIIYLFISDYEIFLNYIGTTLPNNQWSCTNIHGISMEYTSCFDMCAISHERIFVFPCIHMIFIKNRFSILIHQKIVSISNYVHQIMFILFRKCSIHVKFTFCILV